MSTTTTWTGSQDSSWDNAANWTNGVPTVNGGPVLPGEVAEVTGGNPIYSDASLDATTVALDGSLSAAPEFEVQTGGGTFGPGMLVAETVAGGGGVFEPVGSLDNQGLLLADAPGGILQIDALTPGNSLLRTLWTSEGTLRATNGGLLQIAQPASVQTQEGANVPEFEFFQSNGTILADDGGTVQVNYAIGSKGEVIASGGTIVVEAGPGVSGIFESYNSLLTVAGAGSVYIANAGDVDATGSVGEPIVFLDATGTLTLHPNNDALPLLGPIEGFRPGDTIELPDLVVSSPVYNYGTSGGQPGTLNVQFVGGALGAASFNLDGDYRQDSFQVTADGHGIVVTGPVGTATSDTVAVAGSTTRTLAFGEATVAGLAAPLLTGLSTANTLLLDVSGSGALSGAQSAAVVDATGPATVTGSAALNETIAAGSGAFTFAAGTGSGSVFAGGGADQVFLQGGGDWLAALGDGADTVVASSGDDTVGTGIGGSLVFLGAGASSVGSAGADTIVGGTGAATITATGANSDEAFALGGTLQFIAGTGASTVVAGTSAATLYGGGAGGSLMFTDGPTQYWGSGGTDTVDGLAGSLTVLGGAGGGQYFGGTAGNNVITAGTGPVTAIGGGAGDLLTASGSAGDLFAAGAGAETLTGVASSGQNTFFAGFGDDELVGGSGQTALVAGAGNDLLVGGSGLTLFCSQPDRRSAARIPSPAGTRRTTSSSLRATRRRRRRWCRTPRWPAARRSYPCRTARRSRSRASRICRRRRSPEAALAVAARHGRRRRRAGTKRAGCAGSRRGWRGLALRSACWVSPPGTTGG